MLITLCYVFSGSSQGVKRQPHCELPKTDRCFNFGMVNTYSALPHDFMHISNAMPLATSSPVRPRRPDHFSVGKSPFNHIKISNTGYSIDFDYSSVEDTLGSSICSCGDYTVDEENHVDEPRNDNPDSYDFDNVTVEDTLKTFDSEDRGTSIYHISDNDYEQV